ncbi:hypothetical protein BD410DRAFT_592484 [Rickenella mellea]|uniref:Uncharacterized protein n=1 Tax=Rickenella mellea TaxID=50990 RepID=A0A4Y7PP99_9AGAM|nr:hypothetical protein BD410DRAFT_592484 [Rickenella mellea]
MKFGDFIPCRQRAETVRYVTNGENRGEKPNRRSTGIKKFTHSRNPSKISIHSLSTPLVLLDEDSDDHSTSQNDLPIPKAVDSPIVCAYGSRLVEHLGGVNDSAIPEEPENDEATTATLISEGDSVHAEGSVGFPSLQVVKITTEQETDIGLSTYETLVNNDSFEFWDDVPASPASTVKPRTSATPEKPNRIPKSKRKRRCSVPPPTPMPPSTPTNKHFSPSPLWTDQKQISVEQRLANDLMKVESLENAMSAIDTMYEWLETQMEAKFEQSGRHLVALRKRCEVLEERVDELQAVNHGLKAAVETLSGEKTALMRDMKRIDHMCQNLQESPSKRPSEEAMPISASIWHGAEYGPGYLLIDSDESNASGSSLSESSSDTTSIYYHPATHPPEMPEVNVRGRSGKLLNRRRWSSNTDIFIKGKKIAVRRLLRTVKFFLPGEMPRDL